MKKTRMNLVLSFLLFILSGCSVISSDEEKQKVGLLVPNTVNDQVWGTKGYKGLLKLQSRYGFEVFYKEEIVKEIDIKNSVQELHNKGVTLIFGHGNEYVDIFNEIASTYPEIHFISFNGEATEENTTTLSFEGYAMGYFGGMVAAEHSSSQEIAVIAAFPWQPEVEGFIDGAKYHNPKTKVHAYFTEDWDDEEVAMTHLQSITKETNTDVFYPAGDGFNIPVIEKVKEDGNYAIGYVSDQADISETMVLTSTIQHVDKLYDLVAKQYMEDKLQHGSLSFDMQDGVISLGQFSPLLEEDFTEQLNQYVEKYKKTGELPK
ncbi:BMP family ABC transporter substrate-binding protein [Mangrovibacillus cuniculi]|uniref:BMP family ABC transporter substrate-binding protein n=1 Tax=Mangrovibacillus cuniculi TaxID=2593652 RepID=A0A7S8CA41_9BACI|nr:BMP family ABC transporter substrate-binding protein [Mangrovibacillus cuniculi]QPC46061.1 BMP family ABC transporter substrate-binding protein [Mangrovibacillus cuniculi]